MAPPSELACSASKAATTGFLFGSKLNVTCAIQSVAIEPPSRGASKRPITAFIAHLRDSMAVLSHRSRIIQARARDEKEFRSRLKPLRRDLRRPSKHKPSNRIVE